MTTPAITLALSALAAVMFAVWCVLTVIARRLDRRQMADQAEVERRWPMLAVEDFTEDGEIAPQVEPAPTLREERILDDTLLFVGSGFVHVRCRDARRDGDTPCRDCARVLAGKR